MNTMQYLTFFIFNIHFGIILSSTARSELPHRRFLSRISVSFLAIWRTILRCTIRAVISNFKQTIKKTLSQRFQMVSALQDLRLKLLSFHILLDLIPDEE
jgi:hypothetical protein